MKTIIQLSNICKNYDSFSAVSNLSFQICEREVVALLGPNGAGKSTTLSMIYGIQRPSSGEIKLFNEEPFSIRVKERIGVMTQENQIIEDLTVLELILYLQYITKSLLL